MPWYMAPMKDVASCEKLRGGANILRSADVRMRELSTSNVVLPYPEHIGITEGTRGTETSEYPEDKKVKTIPKVVASEIGAAQTECRNALGVRTATTVPDLLAELF